MVRFYFNIDAADIESAPIIEYFSQQGIDYALYGEYLDLSSYESDYIFPEGITEIEEGLFKDDASFTTIVIPEGVTSIGASAFEGCTSLTTVIVPDSCTFIGASAFAGCSALTGIYIPEGVTVINDNCFSGCSALADVILPSTITSIGQNAFSGCSSLTDISIPEGLTALGDYAFYNCSALENAVLPDSLISIGSAAFYRCTKLSSMSVPGSVTAIGDEAFMNCDSLTSVSLPASLTSVGRDAFTDCLGLTSVSLGCSLDVEGMFTYCSNIEHVTVEEGVNFLGNSLFEGCSPTLVAKLPDTLSGMGTAVFPGTAVLVCNEGSRAINLAQHFGYRYVTTGNALDIAATPGISQDDPSVACAYFDVVTEPDATALYLYDETGTLMWKVDAENNSSASPDVRRWRFPINFAKDGQRSVTIRAFDAAGDQIAASGIDLELNGYSVLSAEFSPAQVGKDTEAHIIAVTNIGASELHMFREGDKPVTSWSAAECSTTEGGVRIWNVSYSFKGAGSRKMTFKAAPVEGEPAGTGITAEVTVAELIAPEKAYFAESTAYVNRPVALTVVTPASAEYLHLYAEDGTALETWQADGCSAVEGEKRTWNVSHTFTVDGKRSMSLRCSQDGISVGDEMRADIVISSGAPSVGMAVFEKSEGVRGEELAITALTNANANELVMFAENGKQVKKWDADKYSVIVGSERVWNVTHAFSGTGTRTMTFKATNDGENFGYDYAATVTIGIDYSVVSAAFVESCAYTDQKVSINVVTGADATVLQMYTANGKLIKEWNAEKNSKKHGGRLTWELEYSFSGAGERLMTFVAAMDADNVSAGLSAAIVVSDDLPAVGFAAFDKTEAAKGENVIITAKTNVDATELAMLVKDGKIVKKWPAEGNSEVIGNERVWTIEYSFSGEGDRAITFQATRDGKNYGFGATANIKIK